MSKLNLSVRTTDQYDKQSEFDMRKAVEQQVNGLSEGRLSAKYNAMSSAPTTGNYAVGDFVPNSAPSELGTAGNKYVIEGWVCSSAAPLTFWQKRFLTGN